jgi:hypothetical protein
MMDITRFAGTYRFVVGSKRANFMFSYSFIVSQCQSKNSILFSEQFSNNLLLQGGNPEHASTMGLVHPQYNPFLTVSSVGVTPSNMILGMGFGSLGLHALPDPINPVGHSQV